MSDAVRRMVRGPSSACEVDDTATHPSDSCASPREAVADESETTREPNARAFANPPYASPSRNPGGRLGIGGTGCARSNPPAGNVAECTGGLGNGLNGLLPPLPPRAAPAVVGLLVGIPIGLDGKLLLSCRGVTSPVGDSMLCKWSCEYSLLPETNMVESTSGLSNRLVESEKTLAFGLRGPVSSTETPSVGGKTLANGLNTVDAPSSSTNPLNSEEKGCVVVDKDNGGKRENVDDCRDVVDKHEFLVPGSRDCGEDIWRDSPAPVSELTSTSEPELDGPLSSTDEDDISGLDDLDSSSSSAKSDLSGGGKRSCCTPILHRWIAPCTPLPEVGCPRAAANHSSFSQVINKAVAIR
ncbi:hypothetical protein ACEPAI_7613 [Sanghuangporus weigelae]